MSDTDQKSVDSVLQNIIATDEESASDLGALSDELVDLDALFDALNVAVAEGGDAVALLLPGKAARAWCSTATRASTNTAGGQQGGGPSGCP